ncbi:hypothetical protein F4809DRAFT_666225 [Biscogniauxia mediterranea]|nr:hypothetical protein F4809DRAFT_666225 [Biscogniauxia mediterranea]
MGSTTVNRDKLPSYEDAIAFSKFGTVELGDEERSSYSPCRLQRWKFHFDRYSSWFGILIAIIVGSGITAGTTYGLIKHITRLVSEGKVSSDPQIWMQEAKTKDYDSCYLGCSDCKDPNFAYDACIRTSEIRLQNSNTICDGRKIWNWADRYPQECLQVRGEVYHLQALEDLKEGYRSKYAILVLTALAGIIGAWVTYRVWKRITAGNKRRAEEMQRSWPGWQGNRARVRARYNIGLVVATFLTLFGRPAAAYPCFGHGNSHDAYFANADRTVFVQAHGWLSNCYDRTSCIIHCEEVCEKNGCGLLCRTPCPTYATMNRTPEDYVENIAPKIMGCGFEPVASPGEATHLRLANPGIEKNWWVRLSVNGYNVTTPVETNPEIICLHDIGGS